MNTKKFIKALTVVPMLIFVSLFAMWGLTGIEFDVHPTFVYTVTTLGSFWFIYLWVFWALK